MTPRGLHALARLHGVQTAYYDNDGQRVTASVRGLTAALGAMGVEAGTEARIAVALDRRRRVLWERALPPVVPVWVQAPGEPGASDEPTTRLRLPEGLLDAAIDVTVLLEDGGERQRGLEVSSLPVEDRATVGGRAYVELKVPLPSVPAGYHDLHVEVTAGKVVRRHRALMTAAPARAAGWEVLPGGGWGVFAPLHALWTETAPDRVPHYGLLRQLAERAARLGGGVVGTLPTLAAFLDHPFEPSPYAPVSKLFWNELYVAPDGTADHAAAAPGAGEGLGLPMEGRELELRRAMAIRREALEARCRDYFEGAAALDGPALPPELAAFVARNPGAMDYARFRAATEARGSWRRWPARLRSGDVRDGDADAEAVRYHLFAQWQAERQLAEATEGAEAAGVALYLDLPLGVHPDGYDEWRDPDQFAFGVTAGAPPDALAPQGQDWGFHPAHPENGRLDGHRYFIAALRNHLRFAGVLRIDHVMQLHRMFWVPEGDASDGVYVRYPHEELYAILSLESHRAGAVIVGEDLGTVPRAVRSAMRRHGVPGMHVVQFSLDDADGALVPGRVPEGALASIGTHDTPLFAAWWTGRDARIRGERGLMSEEEVRREVEGRRDLRTKLARGVLEEAPLQKSAAGPGAPAPDLDLELDIDLDLEAGAVESGLAVQEALYRILGRSEAGLVLASAEDLWMETEPQNVPGTTAGNWRRRSRRPVEALTDDPARRLLGALDHARERKG